MLTWSGATPDWQARLVPIPTRSRWGNESVVSASPPSASASTPSRRSPSSTINTTAWVVPARPAAADSASSTAVSLLRLTVAQRTTASTWLTIGERMSVRGPPIPAAVNVARFSTRESASPAAPPLSMAAATLGEPRTALVTAATRIPRAPSRSTRTRVFDSIASRSTSRRGAVIAPTAAGPRRAPGTRRAPCRRAGPGAWSAGRSRGRRAPARSRRWRSRSRRRPVPRG